MAIFLPTHKNVCFLKSILMGDFEMRSAHATEAIAALVGFQSNASFLATSSHLKEMTIFEANFHAFEERSANLGYDRMSSEYLRMIFTKINWPEPVWIMLKKRDAAATAAWLNECQRRYIPFLYVSKATKYCSVHWDHISLDSRYDQMVHKSAEGDLWQVMFRTFQLLAVRSGPKARFEGTAHVGDVTGLSESDARHLANAFATLLFPGNVESALAA